MALLVEQLRQQGQQTAASILGLRDRLLQLAWGTAAKIAERLGISVSHVRRILKKASSS
jgi:DNA-directed RNA polymerase specialized sigma subunit